MKFYETLFAVFCFAFFLVALTTQTPFAYLAAAIFAALSRTAKKKGWWDKTEE
ncbi:hypothetical protein JWG39_00445 [Desulforhopalus vacuolatus]|uniref:hypothetical protein n=1 Tax=Desulforhopalus vacuolatus TaxID=40414 RepID=UPI001962B783|nr:hypothetical protein [Desulforhopalus vacuolatus]MBM9518283.1 hypothetical protein [Desulforhopalus vacuolatus]